MKSDLGIPVHDISDICIDEKKMREALRRNLEIILLSKKYIIKKTILIPHRLLESS